MKTVDIMSSAKARRLESRKRKAAAFLEIAKLNDQDKETQKVDDEGANKAKKAKSSEQNQTPARLSDKPILKGVDYADLKAQLRARKKQLQQLPRFEVRERLLKRCHCHHHHHSHCSWKHWDMMHPLTIRPISGYLFSSVIFKTSWPTPWLETGLRTSPFGKVFNHAEHHHHHHQLSLLTLQLVQIGQVDQVDPCQLSLCWRPLCGRLFPIPWPDEELWPDLWEQVGVCLPSELRVDHSQRPVHPASDQVSVQDQSIQRHLCFFLMACSQVGSTQTCVRVWQHCQGHGGGNGFSSVQVSHILLFDLISKCLDGERFQNLTQLTVFC